MAGTRSAPTIINGLSAIAGSYRGLLCDAWGVIHNGMALYDGVAEALVNFRQHHGPVIILTNAPRLSDVIPKQLDRLGLPRDAYDTIVTSGDATRGMVEQHRDKPFFKLGPEKDETLFEALNIQFVPPEDAQIILCTGLFDDLNETPEDYRELLSALADRRLPMICANPDKVVRLGDRLIYCAGALGDVYQELGGEVILCGKPHSPIYHRAMSILAEKGVTDRSNILAIGDGVHTDILGANQAGVDVAFVAEGIFSEEARGNNGRLDPGRLAALLSDHDVHAAFGLDRLVW